MNHTDQDKAETLFRQVMLWTGAAAFALGALGLFGWVFKLRILTAFGQDYVPMAPDTAVIFKLFGAVLMANALKALPNRIKALLASVVALASIYGLLKFIEFLIGADLTFGDTLVPSTEKVGAFPVWHMSPITGLMIFVSGVALLPVLWPAVRDRAANVVAGLGILIMAAAFVAVAGYIFGSPLLYGSDIIPLSAVTAIAMMILGIGLVVAAGTESVFLRPFMGASIRAKILRAFLPLTAVAAIAQGIIHEYIDRLEAVNLSLAAASTSLTFAFLVGGLAVFTSRLTSRSILRAESERDRLEKELRESEKGHRAIIEGVNEGISIWKDEHLKFANKKWHQMTGYGEEEMQTLSSITLVHPDGRPAYLARAGVREHYLPGETEPPFCYRWITKSGDVRWMEAHAVRIDFEGSPATMIVNKDITERMKMENALRESEQRYRAIVEGASEAISIVQDDQMKFVNPEWQRQTGYTFEEAVAMPANKTTHPDDHPALNERRRLRAAGGEVRSAFNYRRVTKAGEIRWIEARAARIEFEGKPATVTMHSDVTERIKMENALKESEKRYRAIVDGASEAITIWQGDQMKFANPRWQELTGYSWAEMQALDPRALTHPDDLPARLERQRLRQSGREVEGTYSYRLVTKTGAIRWLEGHSARIDWEGSPASIILHSDITDQVTYRDKLEKSLKEKETLLKEVHHRVKNNLQIITSLLNLEMAKSKDGQGQEAMKASQDRVKTMALVHHLLYENESLSQIDLAEYIRGLAEQLFDSYRIDRQLVGLETDLSEITVDMDKAVPCGLILNELVINALKHAFPNQRQGKVYISLTSSGDGKVTLSIRDDGVGLPKDFDPDKPKSLGVRLISSLSEQLGGSFSYSRGPGTEFKITFQN